eukprot:COSAG01_NODE_3940_length_5513_cov_18.497968_7_plen_85_part_00
MWSSRLCECWVPLRSVRAYRRGNWSNQQHTFEETLEQAVIRPQKELAAKDEGHNTELSVNKEQQGSGSEPKRVNTKTSPAFWVL